MRDRNGRSHRAKGLAKGWAGTYDKADDRRGDTDLTMNMGAMSAMVNGTVDETSDPAKRLRVLDRRQKRVMLDARDKGRPVSLADLAERREYVRLALDTFHGDSQQWHSHAARDGNRVYDEERERLQSEIVTDVFREHADTPCEHRALVSGGLGGAGKSSVLASDDFTRRYGTDVSSWLTLDNDDIKRRMAEKGMIPRYGCLSPMELSTLVHEEASDILARIRDAAMRRGMNVILDGTMNNERSTARKIRELHEHGYTVDALFVDITPDTSKRRADQRYQHGMIRFIEEGRGMGGRYLPEHVIDRQRPDPWSPWKSRNAETFTRLARDGAFDHEPLVFDNDVDGRPARPVRFDDFARRG